MYTCGQYRYGSSLAQAVSRATYFEEGAEVSIRHLVNMFAYGLPHIHMCSRIVRHLLGLHELLGLFIHLLPPSQC